MEQTSLDWLMSESKVRGVLAHKSQYGEEAAALQEMITYGMKGVAAYASHAQFVGKEDNGVYADMQEVMSEMGTTDEGKLLGLALKVGNINLRVLSMLDAGHVARFGTPVPTPVSLLPRPGPVGNLSVFV